MFSWKSTPWILALLTGSNGIMAQQPVNLQPVFMSWKAAEVAEPVVVTSEDLSENNGTFTYQADMERGKLVNIALDLNDIFPQGATEGKKLEINLNGLSDVAPDCHAIASSLGLNGTTSCQTSYGSQYYNLNPGGGSSNQSCENVIRKIYENREICTDDNIRRCPDDRIDPRDRLLRRPACAPICRIRKVLVDTVTDRICTEHLYSVNFTVDSYESMNEINRIQSYLGFSSIIKRTKKTTNGAIKITEQVPVATSVTKVPSTTYFSLVCENNRLINQTFTSQAKTIFYSDIVAACGTEGKVYLRSNRPLLFDTGAIFLTFEKPY